MKDVLNWGNILDKAIMAMLLIAFIGVLFFFTYSQTLAYWPWLAVAFVAITSWFLINELFGRMRHRSIIEGDRLRWLTEQGFTVENIGHYWGYKGTYRSYFIRIYYNWQSNLNKFGHELCVMVHFDPPLLHDGQLNMGLLDEANAAVTFHEGYGCLMNFEASYLAYHTPITWLTSRKRIQKRIGRAVETVVRKKLSPIKESAVQELVQGYPLLHGPFIDYFQMAYAVEGGTLHGWSI